MVLLNEACRVLDKLSLSPTFVLPASVYPHNTMTKVLITGATGYIGGSILSHLQTSANQAAKVLEISVLLRNDSRAEYFSSIGLKVYTIQDLDDLDAIKAAASEHDIVIHTASGYHTASARALIQGLGIRKKLIPDADLYYIHTSGTSNLADRPISQAYAESRVFSDKDTDIYEYLKKRNAIEPYAQRTTDLVVVDTGETEDVRTTIIMSPTIYGVGSGKFNRLTIQYPLQMKAAIKSRRAEYVGDGEGKWEFVHISDLAQLYEIVLLDWIKGQRAFPVGEKGFIFSGTGTFAWKDVARWIAKAGVELGQLSDTETSSISLEEAADKWVRGDKQLCELGWASNARTRAEIGKELGWKPTKTRADWERSFFEEFEELVRTNPGE
jgi:nucleoside-diphosphate-sugar epimerase